MSKYLLNEVKRFRVDSELEAQALVDSFRRQFDVVDYSITKKEKKDETYFLVKIKTMVNIEKDPCEAYTEI